MQIFLCAGNDLCLNILTLSQPVLILRLTFSLKTTYI